jgi:hypothetical protein
MHKLGLLITAGAVLIPLGFFIIVQFPEYKGLCTASVLVGSAAWLVAYIIADRRDRDERRQRNQLDVQGDKIVELLQDINDKLDKQDKTTKTK